MGSAKSSLSSAPVCFSRSLPVWILHLVFRLRARPPSPFPPSPFPPSKYHTFSDGSNTLRGRGPAIDDDDDVFVTCGGDINFNNIYNEHSVGGV